MIFFTFCADEDTVALKSQCPEHVQVHATKRQLKNISLS